MYSGEKVKLRGVELEDLEPLMLYWNTYEFRRFLFNVTPHSREEEEGWIKSTWERRRNGSAFLFSIERIDTGEFIGTCGLEGMDLQARSAELGIAINLKHVGQGFGTEAMQLLLWFGFQVLNLNRIGLNVWDFNTRGTRVYEKLGFKHTGRARQKVFREGKYYDALLMDILASEWQGFEPQEVKNLSATED